MTKTNLERRVKELETASPNEVIILQESDQGPFLVCWEKENTNLYFFNAERLKKWLEDNNVKVKVRATMSLLISRAELEENLSRWSSMGRIID